MDRSVLAKECVEVERAGGSVRDYLLERGFISPWGTWYRLQKEELHRKEHEITYGRENTMATRVSLEQKKKAVQIALDGGNPFDFLRDCGSKEPAGLWWTIKQNLKKVDPETYAKLPKPFLGFERAPLSPVGGNRHGVMRMDDFFCAKVGVSDGRLTTEQWLTTPEFYLAEATNGAVFRDDCGAFTAVRERLKQMPEDVRLKKLAGSLLLMAQSGQYNFARCLAHGEAAAAQLALHEFVGAALHAVFLLNRAYLPFYKWQFRALRELPVLRELEAPLVRLLFGKNTSQGAEEKAALLEQIAAAVIETLQRQELTTQTCGDLERHAYSVNDRIADPELRNLHILAAV